MQVLTIASRKGGSGKTTLAGHLAVAAEQAGNGPVAVIDTDPQGSLSDWWNMRAAPAPRFVTTSLASLQDDLATLRLKDTRLVIIDTPPAMDDAVSRIVACSDLVLIPTRPSPHDLRSIGATLNLVERLGKPLVFVINSATVNARLTLETVKLVSRYGPLAPATIHHRVDFAASMTDGRTVMEIPSATRAVEEITKLWGYVSDRLESQIKGPSLPAPSRLGAASQPSISAS